jgi:hypothetical protein
LLLSWFTIAEIFLLSGPSDALVFDFVPAPSSLTEEVWRTELILGSDNLLIRAIDTLVLVALSSFSSLDSGKEDTDWLNLLSFKGLLVLNLLVFEDFKESTDPTEAVLAGNLWRGEDGPGSESLNFDPLWELGENFDGTCLLVAWDATGDCVVTELLLVV